MNQKNSILAIIAGILVLLFVITEPIKFSFYKSEMSSSLSSSWKNSKSIVSYNDSNKEISFPKVPIVVIYKSIMVGDTNSINPVKFDLSDKDFGTLWFPLIKNSDYNFTVTFNKVYELKTDAATQKYNIEGEINVSGHYNLIGFCPTETATNLVVNNALKNIYNDIKKNIE